MRIPNKLSLFSIWMLALVQLQTSNAYSLAQTAVAASQSHGTSYASQPHDTSYASQPQASGTNFLMIDETVRESLKRYFYELRYEVDLDRLVYVRESEGNNGSIIVYSSVWAEQSLVIPYWGWYDCSTEVQINEAGPYDDLGSECYFEYD